MTTDHQRNKIVVEMYTIDRASIASIASTVGTSVSSIYRILKMKGVKLRRRQLYRDLVKSPERQRHHRKLLESNPNFEKLEKARALVEKGHTYKEAAIEVGVTRNMVAGHISRRLNRSLLGLNY